MRVRLMPQNLEGRILAILVLSFGVLLGTLTVFEVLDQPGVVEVAETDRTLRRFKRVNRWASRLSERRLRRFVDRFSGCHSGYTLSAAPYPVDRTSEDTERLAGRLRTELSLDTTDLRAGFALLDRQDFSYSTCGPSEINFPVEGIVVSLRLAEGRWLNAEIHPHPWAWDADMTSWLVRSGTAFLIVGGIALVFIRQISKPLRQLTRAARSFGTGLKVAEVSESGPPDVRQAVRSFNAMQRQITAEMARRDQTLAAISHDVRTPLTALRLKAELIGDDAVRADLIASVDKMEGITASALAFLKGESRTEPMRRVDIGALVDSECTDIAEMGARVTCRCPHPVRQGCRPDALARAVRNLVENAVKYAGSAEVTVTCVDGTVDIAVADSGPGISAEDRQRVVQPFERLSPARESGLGGHGLGLAIAMAVAEGHDGTLRLAANTPTGLIAAIRFPAV
ncbi:ATP-binding protein [Eilatimonas milleporae]|uniref:histidine kinase n=1 Tax=Eilatimonas milleporae TaxID=911205 RepID=A0A3M0CQ90_9PROT|nr:ATP-binding protein [Eilatimonas milleporae]RMB11714.1 signal transduction histidine kinase [Eilatimonas milleporae]